MIVKSSITSQLLKEASARVGIKNRSGRSGDIVKNYLFREASSRVRKRAAINKRAMGLFTAQGRFENSNVSIREIVNDIDEFAHLYDVFQPYFYQLALGNVQHKFLPTDLVTTYEITREFLATGDSESAVRTNKSIESALNIIDGIVPGIKQFVEEINASTTPPVQFFQKSHRNKDEGGYNSADLTEFSHAQARRFQESPLQLGDDFIGESYFQEHAQRDRVDAPGQTRVSKIYPLSDIDTEHKKGKLLQWISYAFRKKYKFDDKTAYAEVQQKENEELGRRNLNDPSMLDKDGIDSRNSIIAYMTGVMPNKTKPFSGSQWGRVVKALRSDCLTGKGGSCSLLSIDDLRIIGKHIKPQIENPEVPNGSWYVPEETWAYHANGFDSTSDDPNTTMPLVPNIKKLPSGHMVFDRDQGNFGGNHARTYGDQLEKLMRKWGSWCAAALDKLDTKRSKDSIKMQSKKLPTGLDPTVAIAAIRNLTANMSNADIMLDTLSKFPDYESYYNNVLNKSLASTYENLNLYSGKTKRKKKTAFTRTNNFNLAQPSDNGSMVEQASAFAQQINVILQQQLGPLNKNDKVQIDAVIKSAKSDIEEMAAILTDQYKAAADAGADESAWNEYALAMSHLGSARAQGSPVVGNLVSLRGSHDESMLSEDGFGMMQKFGYPIAKMMDIVDAIRVRGTNDFTNNRIKWAKDEMGNPIPEHMDEKSFGRKMGTGHGKAGSTKLMVGIRYAFNADELGAYDPALKKRVRLHRGKQKIRIPRNQMDINRKTNNPQRGTPVDPRLTNETDGVVVENITWWIGQASGVKGMHKPLGENEEDRKVENKSWSEVVDYIRQHYPLLEESTGKVFGLLNIDLRRLQDHSKRALKKVSDELDAGAVFVTSEGDTTIVGQEDMPDTPEGINTEKTTASDRAGVTTVEAPPIVETPAEPEPEPITEEPEPVVDETPPSSISNADIESLIMELDETAEANDDMKTLEQLQNIDINVRNKTLSTDDAYQQLMTIQDKLLGDPEAEMDKADEGLMNYWDSKVGSGQMKPSDMMRFESALERIKQFVARKRIPLPANILAYIKESKQVKEQYGEPNEPEISDYDPELDDDNYMTMKSMPEEPTTDFVSRRQKGRSLVRNRPNLNTGKLQRADVIDTMVKMADRLDDAGEFVLADKITLLLQQVSKE